MESLFEYFDRRFETIAQNMEHIISDVNTMRKQIDQLIPDIIHLKQRMADIQKSQ
jgi:polyhydroxyalkanoate synthesis regulator phasin